MSVDTRKIEEIRERIEDAKTRRSKAEGTKERIERQWKEEYDLDGKEAVEVRIKELAKKIEKDSEELDQLLEQLEEAADWEEDDDE